MYEKMKTIKGKMTTKRLQNHYRNFWKNLAGSSWEKAEHKYQDVLKYSNMAKAVFRRTDATGIEIVKTEDTEQALGAWRFEIGKRYTVITGYRSLFGYCEIYECVDRHDQFLAVIDADTVPEKKAAIFIDGRREVIRFIEDTLAETEVDMICKEMLDWEEYRISRIFQQEYGKLTLIGRIRIAFKRNISFQKRYGRYPFFQWMDPELYFFRMISVNDGYDYQVSDPEIDKKKSDKSEQQFRNLYLPEICRTLYEHGIIASADSQTEKALLLGYRDHMSEVEGFDEVIQEYYGSEIQVEEDQILEFYFTCSSDFSEVEMKHILDYGEGAIFETDCLLSENARQTLKGKCMLFAYQKIAGANACI